MAVVECIPNVSEGRRLEVLEACAESIRSAGAALLDVHTDAAHNRSVFTFAGSPTVVRAAVLALFDVALARIDLRTHVGVHPRLGAVDVVPFVPLEGATMADCAALARDVASVVSASHNLPTYLYESAATRPSRRRLEDIRHGEFEGLGEKIQKPEWTPDFGPSQRHPSAGASIIGARPPLVAYNVNLATDRLDIARAIARTVRHSSGGLPCVKALGLALVDRGLVQVSMNLTDTTVTPVHTVFDLILREAERHGVQVLESEVVGLIPAAALDAVAAWYLKIAGFRADQILERRLAGYHLVSGSAR